MTYTKADLPARRPRPVVYPTSDGKPMAETDKHADIMTYAKEALRSFYAPQADRVYVSGNNFVYWREGRPQDRVSPDAYVVFGVPQRQRDSYMSWLEGDRLPSWVLEVTSRKTRREDEGHKFMLYEQVLRVPEYLRFDPTGDYLRPRLQGFRLVDGRYQALPVEAHPDGDRIRSAELGLYLVMVGEELRFFDPNANRFLPTLQEAEAEVGRLRAELERLRRQSGSDG